MVNGSLSNNIVGITNLNTRELTIKLREQGALKAAILSKETKNFSVSNILNKINSWNGIINNDIGF